VLRRPARKGSSARRLLREPLLHFAALGSLVFALHRSLVPAPPAERAIVVDSLKQRELLALFEQRQHRSPTPDEARRQLEQWVEDEVLFREALKLELERQDPALRDQLIARMRSLLQASFDAPEQSDANLRAYHAAHASRYAVPASVSFTEYEIAAGPDAEDRAREVWRRLRLGQPVEPMAIEHRQRSEPELVVLYGAALGAKILKLEPRSWQLLRSARGLHLVRLEARSEVRDPSYAELETRLRADLQAERAQQHFDEQLAQLTRQWSVQQPGESR
jgi:hypothetical protein